MKVWLVLCGLATNVQWLQREYHNMSAHACRCVLGGPHVRLRHNPVGGSADGTQRGSRPAAAAVAGSDVAGSR